MKDTRISERVYEYSPKDKVTYFDQGGDGHPQYLRRRNTSGIWREKTNKMQQLDVYY